VEAMRLVTTRDATKLTGLSTEQLREWTSRRALIPADVKPKGHGSPARYSWETILLLRLAVTLRGRFRLELQAHRDLFTDLGAGLRRVSFFSLWGKSLALHGGPVWSLLEQGDLASVNSDFIVLRLDPHLEVLSARFALAQRSYPEQLQLFPALRVVDGPPAAMKSRMRKAYDNAFMQPVRRLR